MLTKRLSILVATGGYYPGKKYMGITTSRSNFVAAMKDMYNIYILTVNHDYGEVEPYKTVKEGWNKIEGINICYLPEKEITKEKVKTIIKDMKIDLVYASGTITSYFNFNRAIFDAANEKNTAIIVTPDGDLNISALKVKYAKKMLAVLLCRIAGVFKGVFFQATSEEEAGCVKRILGVNEKFIFNVPFFRHPMQTHREKPKEKEKLEVVYAARIHPIKNLKVAIQAVCELEQEISFDIYGVVDDENYWSECKELIQGCKKKNIQINYCGELSPDKACMIYRNYDCMILPTKGENYCFSIEEALSCGCPVIISKGTTPWDDIDYIAGYTVDENTPDGYGKALSQIGQMNALEYTKLVNSVVHYMEKKDKTELLKGQYDEMFYKAINEK